MATQLTCAMILTSVKPDWTYYKRWQCPQPATYEKPLCYEHWKLFDSFEIEECERCHGFQSMGVLGEGEPPLCGECYLRKEVPVHIHAPIERQTRWMYVLKLDGGGFYVGQTNELELRLGEHRDGTVRSTAGKHPRLVWFDNWLGERDELLTEEARMTKLANENPRAIRRMVNEWQRPLRLLDLGG